MDTVTITAYFGNNKIKAFINEPDKISDEKYKSILIDFKEAKFYLINSEEKNFKINKLDAHERTQKALKSISRLNKTILNFKTTAYTAEEKTKSLSTEKASPLYWYADTLFFSFDTVYAGHYSTKLFGNGRNICLGRKEITGEGSKDYNTLLEALSVEQMKLADSLFTIPSDFLPEPEKQTIIESEATTDTTRLPFKTKKSTNNKSPSKNTHNQPTKSSAIKPKQ